MIIECENMKRGYGASILTLAELCILTVLAVQNVCAYPHAIYQNERNAIQFPDLSRDSDRNGAQSELNKHIETTFEDGDRAHLERRRRRDASRYHGTRDAASISFDSTARASLYPRIEENERMQADTKFVFPGEIAQVPVCKGSTYCENIDSYPEDIVSRAIQRNESLKYLAGVDVVPDITQRIDVTDDVPLCVSTEQVIFPQSAENKDKEWKLIANQENFKQGIRIEKCTQENTSCSVIGGLAEGYKTSCKQKYVYRQLASVQADGKIVPDTFRFPSSCCCHVSFNGNPLIPRVGVNTDEQRSQVTPVKTRKRK